MVKSSELNKHQTRSLHSTGGYMFLVRNRSSVWAQCSQVLKGRRLLCSAPSWHTTGLFWTSRNVRLIFFLSIVMRIEAFGADLGDWPNALQAALETCRHLNLVTGELVLFISDFFLVAGYRLSWWSTFYVLLFQRGNWGTMRWTDLNKHLMKQAHQVAKSYQHTHHKLKCVQRNLLYPDFAMYQYRKHNS